MDALNELKKALVETCAARLVEDDIYSVLPDATHAHHYDRRASAYDLVVSTRLYNAVAWGSSPLDYITFARQALASSSEGRLLDAGCGSLLFTAPSYLDSHRQILAFDQSIVMLRRARRRLLKLSGSVPSHILLLQADLNELPFRPDTFRTVLSLNVLHHFANAATLLANFKQLLTGGGQLFLTSLVSNNRFMGDRYLSALYRTGEFVRPRSKVELQDLMVRTLGQGVDYRVKGNMAFGTAAAPF